MHLLRFRLLPVFLALFPSVFAAVHQGNGFKIGEVTSDSAVIWTRLTTHAEANWAGVTFVTPEIERAVQSGAFDWKMQLPAGKTLADMQGALPGAPGEVRVIVHAEKSESMIDTGWAAVRPAEDHVRQFPLRGLRSYTRYRVTVQSRDAKGAAGPTLEGGFTTAPAAGNSAAPTRFVVVTCGDYPRRDDPANGHRIYQSMLGLSPDFLVHTGDVEYFDKADPIANSPELARFKFNRLFALPFNRAFHQRVASYFLCDDHDILKNDCWPGQTYGSLTFAEGSRIFREQMPAPTGPLYRTVRWGRDLQFWMMEGREFRSPNTMPDGPAKTIWGREQKTWLYRTVAASDATFKVLLTPTPIVGPDRGNKGDNHANAAFKTEGDEIRKFIGGRKDMVVMNGDRHWQYMSVHPATGVREFGCGPSSDVHAGGYKPVPGDELTQKFFRLKGGFLSAEVRRTNGKPRMVVRHHDVNGAVVNEVVIEAAGR